MLATNLCLFTMAQIWSVTLHSSHAHAAGITLVTDGTPPTKFTKTMADMVEMVPVGLRYGVHASAAVSRHQGTTYWISGYNMRHGALLSEWHSFNGSILHHNISNRLHNKRTCLSHPMQPFHMFSATDPDHRQSCSLRIHTMPPPPVKNTAHGWLEEAMWVLGPLPNHRIECQHTLLE